MLWWIVFIFNKIICQDILILLIFSFGVINAIVIFLAKKIPNLKKALCQNRGNHFSDLKKKKLSQSDKNWRKFIPRSLQKQRFE